MRVVSFVLMVLGVLVVTGLVSGLVFAGARKASPKFSGPLTLDKSPGSPTVSLDASGGYSSAAPPGAVLINFDRGCGSGTCGG